ncbi:MAG: glycosyltransferase family 2 protein [Candidatus Dormibacteria bacterium]
MILVTYGAWEWTARCLAALTETIGDVRYELICVDNASPDGSAERMAAMPEVHLIRNARNVGYGAAVNQAVMRAKAAYILLLNTDAIVQPGWLEPLRQVLIAEDDVAAVSARLLHLDGTLQEAGSLIWGDGMTDCYGDGGDPNSPEYCFRRDVDYASAACLLVRRSAFVNAGGFDPVYQPAYHEDTDLAMRWRSQGLRVVYQPLSTVVHKRWASSEDRVATETLVTRHRPIFLERWRSLVGERPSRPRPFDPRCLVALRDSECDWRVLGVVDSLASNNGREVASIVAKAGRASGRCRQTILALGDDLEGAGAAELRASGVEVVPVAGTGAGMRWLDGRRYHYTSVVATADVPRSLSDHLVATQPGAVRLFAGGDMAEPGRAPWLQETDVIICLQVPSTERLSRRPAGVRLIGRDEDGADEEILKILSGDDAGPG